MARLTREQQAVQDAIPQYVLSGEIGRGAFGVVYGARHQQLGREVAIKQLPRAFAADPSVRERFVAEAQLVAALDHPHIVPVYDFVDRDDGICLIIMERCQRSVTDEFEQRGLATDEACAAVLACCAALEEAHQHGLLHRDVKPENLLYDAKGVVKLADFGVARVRVGDARRTATGTVIGTPAYMSPEQVRGEELTVASDVYSVGIMAYELLTGSLPFPGATTSTGLLAHHLVTAPTPLLSTRPELPHGVAVVVDRALAKDPADRPQTSLEFATELTRACVSAFGEGWIRRRRFVLHWSDVLAVSERPAPNAVRTGTIVVTRAPADTSADGLPAPTAPRVAPEATRDAGAVPAMGGPPSMPSDGSGRSEGSGGLPPPSLGATPPPGRRRALIAAGAVAAVVALAVVVTVLLGGRSDEPDDAAASNTFDRAPASSAPSPASLPTATSPSSAPSTSGTVGPTTTFDPLFVYERPPGIDFRTASSPFAPTPCPDDQPMHACIWLPLVPDDPDDGDLSVYYFTSGFVPELEPAGMHLHFFLDTVVDGDERRAGSEVPGGTWKPWDGPFPFSTFGGQNGRTGYSMADVAASGARQLCVIVADAEQRALPGTGNCAPIVRTWESSQITLAQVDRLTGTYHGGCSIGGSLILPDSWRAVDLVATPVEEAAAMMRPTDVAAMQTELADLVAAGGVLWGDGPVIEGFTPSMWMQRIPGEFTLGDAPATVADRFAQLGVDIGTTAERTVVDRTLLSGVRVDGGTDGADLLSYVVPDHGHALVVTFEAHDATARRAITASEAVVATLNGC